jgi:deazaflavin-dependent oxidoreductase (nitroreductase family)
VKLRRLGNAFPKLILSSPLHPLMSRQYLLLTFIGRKSGRSYTTPVAYLQRGDTLIFTTDSPWWSNFTTDATVSVRVKGLVRSGAAQPVRNPEEAVEGLAALVEAIPWYGKFAGVRRDEQGRADQADAIRAIDGGRVLVRVELCREPTRSTS